MSNLKEWRHIANHSTSGDMVWNILMDWQKSEDALRKQLSELENELNSQVGIAQMYGSELIIQRKNVDALQAKLEEWEEKEAACCPEDFGFDEVIKSLRKQLDESNRKLEQRIALEIDEHLKVVELQAKLDVAVEALKKARAEVVQYYPPHEYTLEIIDEALKRLEA
jgi:vacuolar-type H+-ATPase subunit I/STV1